MTEPSETRDSEPETLDGELLPAPTDAPLAQPVEGTGGAIQTRFHMLPAPVVAAAGGFLAGVATFVLVRLLRRPKPSSKLARATRRGKGKDDVVASRSFLVDVHLLRR